ncbi:MAG: hypothetical protein NXI24_06740 [bacterium]|nr:hypothetical protein [bacterium]
MSRFDSIFQKPTGEEAEAGPLISGAPGAFVGAIRSARRNLKRPKEVGELIPPAAVRQAQRLQHIVRMPRMLEEVYVRGYENLPLRKESAPILALSHKKFQDVAAIVELIAGRPLDRFHDITLIAQGGLFSAMYAYRDMVPAFCKRGAAAVALRRPAVYFAHRLGNFLRQTFTDVNAYPVYREGRDIPISEEDFQDPNFAGPRITGRSYADFVKYANRETLKSVLRVQKDMEERNRMFFIMPEGGYCHDGSVAPLQDFLGVFAFRKQAPTVFGALSYDELCPDRLGRISAFINLLPPSPPPQTKQAGVADFLDEGRRLLTEHTVILASHLIAAVVYEYLERDESFGIDDLRDAFDAHCCELVAAAAEPSSAITCDPGLAKPEYRADRLRRFLRYGSSRYFQKDGRGRLRVSKANIEGFAHSERTVNDIEWNRNHARHFYAARDAAK